MKKLMTLALLLTMVAAAPAMVFAEASPWTEEEGYWNQSLAKLEYGVINVVGGWTEIFTTLKEYKAEGKNCAHGLGKGAFDAVVYTVGGALHAATFFIPVDLPIPDGGVPVE